MALVEVCSQCGTELDTVADWVDSQDGVFCHGCGEVVFGSDLVDPDVSSGEVFFCPTCQDSTVWDGTPADGGCCAECGFGI